VSTCEGNLFEDNSSNLAVPYLILFFNSPIIVPKGLSSSGMMRRSRSASTELSEASLGGMKAKEGSKSMGNLNQYGRRPHPDREETSSMQSFHSTSGDIVATGGKSSQRIRSVSESDANSEPQGPTYYRDITLEKEDNESFGFVILSSVQKTGPTIGKAYIILLLSLCQDFTLKI